MELPAEWCHHPGVWNLEVQSAEDAVRALAVADYAAVVLNLPIPGWTAPVLLNAVQRAAPGIPVLARDPNASLADAVRLAHLGICQFLPVGVGAVDLIDQAIEDGRLGGLVRMAAQIDGGDWRRLLVGARARCANYNI